MCRATCCEGSRIIHKEWWEKAQEGLKHKVKKQIKCIFTCISYFHRVVGDTLSEGTNGGVGWGESSTHEALRELHGASTWNVTSM